MELGNAPLQPGKASKIQGLEASPALPEAITVGKIVPSTYIASLTGVRAIAALLVLSFHTAQNLPSAASLIFPFVRRGYLGVDLFFLLSGFVITLVYWRFMEVRRRDNVRVFLWHRFIRLYPGHFTVLLVLMSVVLIAKPLGISLNHPEAWSLEALVKQLLLVQVFSFVHMAGNFGSGWNAPTWSISAECFAYLSFSLVAPFFLVISRSRLRSAVAATAVLLALTVMFKFAKWPLGTIVGISALLRVCCEFYCGAALCRNLTGARRLPEYAGDIVGFGALLFFIIGASSHLVSDFILAPALALFVWGTAAADGPLRRALSYAPIAWLGEISYSIYLTHMPALWILRRVWERLGFLTWSQSARAAAIVLTISIVVLVSACLFYCVERPIRIRYRDSFGKLVLPR